MAFVMHHSIHGRRLGLSSTGGIVQGVTSTGGGSTAMVRAAQMWGDGMVTTHSSSLATFNNFGTNYISSASATSANFTMPAPVNGVYCEILSGSSATAITIETTGVANFKSTGGDSTEMVFGITNGAQGAFLNLRGVGSTLWIIASKAPGVI